jgi:hypothetical protein
MRYLVFSMLVMISGSAIGQDSSTPPSLPRPTPHQIIKISPFQFFAQTFEMSLESINQNYTKAFQISAGYRSGQIDFSDGRGATVTLAYRNYARPMNTPLKNHPEVSQGIYYSVYVKGDSFKGTETYFGQPSTETKILSISPGFTLGLQRTLFEVLFLDIYVGGGIKFPSITYSQANHPDQSNYDIMSPGYSGIYPAIGVKVGIRL